MSIENITSKIIGEAEAQAKEVTDAAEVKKAEILAEAEKKAAEMIEDAEKRGRADKERLITRRRSVADIDGRKFILGEKQKLIAECFDKTVDRITSLDEEEYTSFLVTMIKNTAQTEGELILSRKDRDKVGETLMKKLADEIPGSGIVLSDETRNIRGGFLLRSGSVFIDGTVEALLEEAKETLVGEVAGTLFR